MFFVLMPIEMILKVVAIAAMCFFVFIVFCFVSAAFNPTPKPVHTVSDDLSKPLCSQSTLTEARGGLTVKELAFLNDCRSEPHLSRP
jgi:hypothetical protein